MTRREAAEKVFNYIKENKFTPTNIKYGDGYFIFDMGDDSVVHFNIKGIPGWKFGMWINTDPEKLKNDGGEDYPAVQFFCRHKIDLDKFKPSRSFFRVNISLEEMGKDDTWGLYEIEKILKMIKRHPLIAFQMSWCEDHCCDSSYIGLYLRSRLIDIKYRIRDWWEDASILIWHSPKVWFIKKYKVVDTVELHDNNHDGWVCSPRYDMKIHFKKISDDEEEQARAEIKVLDKFFHKDYYKNMGLELTRDGIECLYYYDDNDNGKP